jgi:hypothetical protein
MATAITLPTSSGNVSETGIAGGAVNVRGFAVRSGSAACNINLREASSTGKIVVPIYLAANGAMGDVWSAPIVCKSPLYCEIVGGLTQDAAVVYID